MTAEEIAAALGAGSDATPEQFSHDAAHKAIFGHPETVTSLRWDCIPEPFVKERDFSTLERLSGEYVTGEHPLAFSDNAWRVRWKNYGSSLFGVKRPDYTEKCCTPVAGDALFGHPWRFFIKGEAHVSSRECTFVRR